MRKFLAALLAVITIMAVVAMVPVSAEATKSGFDGTTSDDAAALPLVVTEVMTNTTAGVYEEGTTNYSDNAFQYIEVYNRGETAIDLYDLALVRAKNALPTDPWESQHKFLEGTDAKGVKLSLNQNAFDGVYNAPKTATINNPAGNCIIEPGQFAIIWVWNSHTFNATTKNAELGAATTVNNVQIYHKAFRDHYRSQNPNATIADDVPIVAVIGAGQVSSTDSTARWSLNTSSNYTYALVWDQASGKNFDPNSEVAFKKTGSGENAIYDYSDEIVCLWQWGVLTNASIPSGGVEGKATIYVPAHSTPDRYNRQQMNDKGLTEILERMAKIEAGVTTDADGKAITVTDEEKAQVTAEALAKVTKADYLAADLVYGYKEVAIMAFEEEPTIGTMPDYQWAYVDPARAPAEIAATEGWAAAAINTYITTKLPTPEKDVENAEEKRDVVLKDRSELGQLGINKKDPTVVDEGGVNIVLIIIIVAAVLVVAAAAVVVIIVIKKKNKPVALDDVATEGEVEIIDETAAPEAEAEEKTEE